MNWLQIGRLDNGKLRVDMSVEHADYIRGKQLHAYRSLLPFGLLASLFNSIIVVGYFAFHSPSLKLYIWSALMTVLGALGVRATWVVLRHQPPARPRAAKELYRPITESAILGAAWAACPALFLPGASGIEMALILCVCGGMMTGAAYMLSTLPGAAIPFVTVLSFGTAVGLIQSGHGDGHAALLALLACFTVVMIRSTFWNYSNYVRTWLHQAQLKDQADQLEHKKGVISLLLNEFEQAASDCLWELDEQYRIVRPSDVLAERTGLSVSRLDRHPIIKFFDASNREGASELAQLKEALKTNSEINNLRLPVLAKGETRWWRISAKPVFDTTGTFTGYRGVASDVTEKFEAERQIFRLAHYDALTELPKREMLLEALDQTVSGAVDSKSRFAILAMDMDRFKTINDVFGNSVGDEYLKVIAQRLREVIGPDDLVARFGGDEFAILQRDVKEREDTIALAEDIQTVLSRSVWVDGARVQSSVSIGVALFPDHSEKPADLLKFADLALLASKKAGRDTICEFEPVMNSDASHAILLENDLKDALKNNEFELHFQPIIQSDTGETCACETLLRWTHPSRGAVGPDDFVPILEQAGLISTVGNWVIREALQNASYWDESVRISINLSPLQVRDRSLIATVTHALAQSGVSPDRVDFEITETALFDGAEDTLNILRGLRNLGVTVSVDDFGTGYSSLKLLQMFPFDKIKIDKSFVQQMDANPECRAIVRSVISLARDLGMRSTAEGVETKTMADLLVAEGCVELQGYHFSRPRRAADLLAEGLLCARAPVSAPSASLRRIG